MSVNESGLDLSDQPVIETATFRVTEPVDGTRRRKPRGPRAASVPVTHVTVHPEVWAAALRLAGGNASRIEVRTATDVTVHNRPWRRQKGTGNA